MAAPRRPFVRESLAALNPVCSFSPSLGILQAKSRQSLIHPPAREGNRVRALVAVTLKGRRPLVDSQGLGFPVGQEYDVGARDMRQRFTHVTSS